MQLLIDIDENLYTRLFDNGGIDVADMSKACTAIRKGKKYNNDWISVKDGLPKKDGRYLCTIYHKYSNLSFINVVNFANNLRDVDEFEFYNYTYNRSGWYDYDSEYGNYEVEDVVAWMELPKAYKYNPFKE